MERFNETRVINTLEALLKILNKNDVEYRLLGSVVTSAMNKGVHRKLGDIDLLIDKDKKDIVFRNLKKIGYKQEGGMFAFGRKYLSLETLVHDELLSIGYFWGSFTKVGTFLMGGKIASGEIESKTIQAEKYTLNGIDFIGLNRRAIATGIMQSAQNPKRKKEVELLKFKNIKPFESEGIHIKILGIPSDWLYTGSMAILRLIGTIRVKVGLTFDPWRSKIN